MDKLNNRTEKYEIASTVTNTDSEFFYNEQDNTLYWINKMKNSDKSEPQRLANFEVLIKRRYNLIIGNYVYEKLIVTLRGKNLVDIDIFLSEYSSLMQQVRKIPGYCLYSDTRRQIPLFEQYISEIYLKIVNVMSIEIVYQDSGWHMNELAMPHYYSGNDINNCLSDFRLASTIDFNPRDLIEWGIGLFSIGIYEVMLPLIIHAHLGYTLKLFEDAGYHEQYILLLIGDTGSKKTSLARVMFNLFGEGLVNFTFTDRAIELSIMKRQDSTLIFDDLSCGSDRLLSAKFERILRQLGDSTGRRRTINGGTEQDEVRTRCAVVLTAETDINALGKSSKLRTLAININKNSFDESALCKYQQEELESHSLGHFSKLEQYMTLYVQFLESNYIKIVETLSTERLMETPINFAFSRQAMIFKMMISQLKLIMDFWRVHVGISDNEYFAVYNLYENFLINVLKKNEERIVEVESHIIFLQITKTLVATQGIIALDKNTFLSCLSIYKGYWHGCNLMIMSDFLCSFVMNYCATYYKRIFPENLKSVLKKLYELDLIEVYEQKDHAPKLLKQVKINNMNQYFVCLKWQSVELLLNQVGCI